MGERARTVAVHLEYLDHTPGLWCNRCMLSTGMLVWVAVTHGPRMHMQQRPWCYEHHGPDGVEATDAGH